MVAPYLPINHMNGLDKYSTKKQVLSYLRSSNCFLTSLIPPPSFPSFTNSFNLKKNDKLMHDAIMGKWNLLLREMKLSTSRKPNEKLIWRIHSLDFHNTY